ncbi:hypothetical protein ABIG06_007332 [Bradyrhizobium sp. USDA 326]|uniref:hypothetical protein n=1 Tax=unclassified Bradyrhizobium TaxID=2631580 RepID=UPI0035194AFE
MWFAGCSIGSNERSVEGAAPQSQDAIHAAHEMAFGIIDYPYACAFSGYDLKLHFYEQFYKRVEFPARSVPATLDDGPCSRQIEPSGLGTAAGRLRY